MIGVGLAFTAGRSGCVG